MIIWSRVLQWKWEKQKFLEILGIIVRIRWEIKFEMEGERRRYQEWLQIICIKNDGGQCHLLQ